MPASGSELLPELSELLISHVLKIKNMTELWFEFTMFSVCSLPFVIDKVTATNTWLKNHKKIKTRHFIRSLAQNFTSHSFYSGAKHGIRRRSSSSRCSALFLQILKRTSLIIIMQKLEILTGIGINKHAIRNGLSIRFHLLVTT